MSDTDDGEEFEEVEEGEGEGRRHQERGAAPVAAHRSGDEEAQVQRQLRRQRVSQTAQLAEQRRRVGVSQGPRVGRGEVIMGSEEKSPNPPLKNPPPPDPRLKIPHPRR